MQTVTFRPLEEATQTTTASEFAKIEPTGPLSLTDENEEDDELEAALRPYSSLEMITQTYANAESVSLLNGSKIGKRRRTVCDY